MNVVKRNKTESLEQTYISFLVQDLIDIRGVRILNLGEKMKLQAAIFDMDGLLLDTETIYTLATQQILSPFKLEFTWELKSKMMGLDEQTAAEILVKETGIDMTAAEYLEQRTRLHEKMFLECGAMPGALELVTALRDLGVKLGVATSSHKRVFELKKRNNHGLFSMFELVVCGDEISRGKPDPEIFQACAEKLGVRPSECMVFEDSKFGVQGALNGGFYCCWVPHAQDTIDDGLRSRCNFVLKSLKDFDIAVFKR